MAPSGPFLAPIAGMILAAGLSSLPVAIAAAQTANTAQTASPDSGASTGTAWRPTATQASQIQTRLKELGFNPGRPDGNIGPRTTAAILAYQGSIGARADGIVTLEFYQRLMAPDIAAAPPAAYALAGPSPPDAGVRPASSDDCPTGPRELWRFHDSFGSSFELTLQTDGTVDGPTYPGHWQWQPTSQGIEIVYDNAMGLRVTRIGHLQGEDSMMGEAADSRGRSWAWSAQRLLAPAADNPDCQTGGGAP